MPLVNAKEIICVSKLTEEKKTREPIKATTKFILTEITNIVNNQLKIQPKITKKINKKGLDLQYENDNPQPKIETSFNVITEKLQSNQISRQKIKLHYKLKTDSIKAQNREENEKYNSNPQNIYNSKRTQSSPDKQQVRVVKNVYSFPILNEHNNQDDKSILLETTKSDIIEESNLLIGIFPQKNSFLETKFEQKKPSEEVMDVKVNNIFHEKKKDPIQELKKSLVNINFTLIIIMLPFLY